jgi:hypothetical protein
MTIAEVVDQYLRQSPFLEEALADNLINVSSLARRIQPIIEQKLQKPVKEGAIIVAINRREPNYYYKINIGIKGFLKNLGDIIVRSDLRDYTYVNSETLMDSVRKLIGQMGSDKDLFVTVSRGIYETTIIVSRALEGKVASIFRNEKRIAEKTSLSSITIRLPKNNTEISGIYYFILKKIAWAGINIVEVISTTNEFTLIVSEEYVHQALGILIELKSTK